MTPKPPTPSDVESIASSLNFDVSPEEIGPYHAVLEGLMGGFAAIDEIPEDTPEIRYPRDSGERPSPEDNLLNAWYVKTRVEGAKEGKLAGRTIALKDNIMLAGVPMMNGAATVEGYVPPIDAAVVTRILDAGGTIVGKAVCESYCFSGASHTSATGPVHNPHRARVYGGRLVVGQRRAGCRRRGRHGDGRRSGRLDPHARVVLWHIRHETHGLVPCR